MMDTFNRDHLGLTQERLASWLGANRATLAAAETGRRRLPPGLGLQDARLTLAIMGRVLTYMQPDNSPAAPPPLPPPACDPLPLTRRLRECKHQLYLLRRQLESMQAKAAQFENRLVALPALRAYTGPVRNPAREAGWLALLEGEAMDALRGDCGAGPQRLLEARMAGLEHEAELLEELLATLLPAPDEQPGP
jgi:DNA-binding XRE family transcriptional regulator